jgi:uroporphyrinogen decarboxylase
MAEPLTGMLSPTLAEEFSAPYVKKIVDAVQDENFTVVYHNCGNNVLKMTDALLNCGADCYHLGNAISLREALEVFPSDKLVMGNVDPVLIRTGTPEQVSEQTATVLSECSSYDNFVISTGCDVPHDSPIENIQAFFDEIK